METRLNLLYLIIGISIVSACKFPNNDCRTVSVDFTNDTVTQPIENVLNIKSLTNLKSEGKLSSIDKVLVNDSIIYIQDKIQNSLLLFNRNGQLRRIIKKYGRGHGEYLSFTDFVLDEKSNIILYDSDGQKILIFNNNGDYIKQIPSPVGGMITTSTDGFVIHSNYADKEYNLFLLDKEGLLLNKIPYMGIISQMSFANGGSLFYDGNSCKLYFTNSFDYTIYKLENQEALIPLVTFDFGKESLEDDILYEKNYVTLHSQVIKSINKVLFIRIIGIYMDNIYLVTEQDKMFVYNTNEHKVTLLNNLELPYNILLQSPFNVQTDGKIFSIVNNQHLSQVLKVKEFAPENYPFLDGIKTSEFNDNDYWLVEGILL